MSKELPYPHIFSLAIAGIKHHGYQNYIFHPLKTDFIGDSGFGKSMIADMLQLVFVGASEFKPGTQDPNRTPKNMILTKQGHSGLGYVFLNIKVAPQAYLVVGMYIETNSNRVRAFIVQAGYDWEGENSLAPFTYPLSYTATITDNKLLPIDEFIEKMEKLEGEQRRIIKVFDRIQSYHEILKLNGILPIDFSKDKQKLRDYVHILYSLARGKSEKPLQNDSERLKSFLFGDQDAEDLLRRFESEDKTWLYSLEDYERNKTEIGNVQEIGSKLQELKTLDAELNCAQEQYLTAQAKYHHNQHQQLEREIAQISTDLVQAQGKLLMVKHKEAELELAKKNSALTAYHQDIQALERLEGQLKVADKENQEITEKLEIAEKSFRESQESIKKIEQIESWLSTYNHSLTDLRNQFAAQLHNKEERKRLSEFKTKLTEKKLLSAFEVSSWIKNYERAKWETKEQLEQLSKRLQFLESLRTFSNLDDPDSLARWALERGKPLSQVEESILLYFQGFPIREPERKKGERYVSSPEKLFEESAVERGDDKGFWLGLSGTQEFIPLEPQHLSNLQSEDYRAELATLLQDAETEYQSLLVQKEELEQLQNLLGYEGAKEPIELFKRRHKIESFIIDLTLPEQQKAFEEFILIYNDSQEIRRDYELRNQTYQSLKEEEKASVKKKFNLEFEIEGKNKSLASLDPSTLEQDIHQKELEVLQLKEQLEALDVDHIQDEFKGKFLLNIEPGKLRDFSDKQLTEFTKLQSKREEKQAALLGMEVDLQQALKEYESTLKKPFSASECESILDCNSAKQKFDRLKSEFPTRYNFVAEKFAKNDYHRLKGATDIGLLAYTLLPRVFPSPGIDRTSITENVANYLASINEKNRQINQGRIDFLIDIFEKVRAHHQHYLFKVLKELRSFFSSEAARITGGYKVTLSTPEIYPINWIGDLSHSLDAWKKRQASLFIDITEETSLDDIVFDTFKKYTSRSKAPDIKELLDPKSYFELNFELRNAGGVTQGSTGQAYTAIALLCIARLSLIEERTGNTGIRFMPIDEAEGIGSNYETLRKLALLNNYRG